MITRNEYLQVFEKYLAGNASQAEIELLMQHKDDFELVDADFQSLSNKDLLAGQRILEKLNDNIGHIPTGKLFNIKRWLTVAAAAIVLMASGLALWKSYYHHQKPIEYVNKKNDVGPGGEKAILTLANGKKIVLTDAGNGVLAKQGNISIQKQKNGIVKYVISGSSNGSDKNAETGMNTISTPRGGEYNVVLPDGTAVWLNAASSIRFPSSFTGHERNVELNGEAYFEVAKNKDMPFKVKFKDQVVQVLGTHFNIKAYSDDDDSKTTLLEGSVKISKNNTRQMLVPGEQAVSYVSANNFTIQHPNLQEVMAWKNGYFIFHETSVQNIMKQAARWYDVDVTYTGDMSNEVFGGRISKYKNISELLKNMELTGTIHFKVEGRRITVMQ